jgi:hypothetical protein
MTTTGPITTDTTTLPLGLAQIRVGASAANIANVHPVLTSADSLGAMASTKFTHNIDYFRHESGFPLLEDAIFPLRGTAMMECAFEELTPKNLALAHGIDSTTGYDEVHSGEIALGNLTAPAYIRMEANYTFPDGTHYLNIIFPRAQVSASPEVDLQKEDVAAVTIVFESKIASSEVSGGNAAWDDKPLGRMIFT